MTKENVSARAELATFGYQQELQRSLTCWHLIAFGLNYMTPIAPAVIFGFILKAAGGSVALPYLLAGIAMSFTAMSYATLIQQFPIAGSLYSYISRSINPHVGFLAGWVLMLVYLLVPTTSSMSATIFIRQFFPNIPFNVCLLLFTTSTGLINLFGMDVMAKLGLWLLIIGEAVIFTGFAVWSYAIQVHGVGVGHLVSWLPFEFNNLSGLAAATSLAVFSYLGFDAITTLAEEAINPKRDIPIAIFCSILIGGITMCITGYLAMLVIPHWQSFINDPDWLNASLFYVAQLTGGKIFAVFYTAGFVLATAVFNVVATAAGARLLYGMGRDNVLPRKIFSAINQRWKTPHWNIFIIIFLEFLLGIIFTIDKISALVNYGALLGFLLLNASVIWLHYVKKTTTNKHFLKHFLSPLLGMSVTVCLIAHAQHITLVVGSIWLACGMLYGALQSKGYQDMPATFIHGL